MSLTKITESKISALFKETGAFYAFSKKQLNEKKEVGVKYASLGGGLICPLSEAEKVNAGMNTIYKNGIQEDKEANGIEGIIKRELFNYECFYTGEIDDCVDALESYEITQEEILAVFLKLRPTVDV